mmetsp:Transcript_26623/g.48790  ORF Transcript_26623/g.48790 Transcript_26623/m.48790 type:complete len:125 (+) Transcript_26623:57-431(+)
MPKERGVVNTWNVEKQFGFVSVNSGKPDAFMHSENIIDRGLRDEIKAKGFKRGDKIRFDLEPPERGRGQKMVAVNIELDGPGGRSSGGRKRSSSRSRSRPGRARSSSRRRSASRGRSDSRNGRR